MLSLGIFTYSTKPRGSVVHATRLAEALVDAGHDATVYALGKNGATFYRPLRCPVRIFAAAEAPSDADALVRQRVAEFVAGLTGGIARHDVWHAQDCLAASALLQVRSPSSPPVVRTVHHVERFESPYLAACQRRSILEADHVFAVSAVTRRDVANEFGRDASLVPNGVDVERFTTTAGDAGVERRSLGARFGIVDDDLVVLSVGGVEPRKNTLRSLAAVRRAFALHPRLRWVVVGDSSLWDHSAYAARFDADLALAPPALRARVVRAGTVADDDLTALYRRSDVLLFPSEQEGFGLAVLEAMAAGVAAIVPRGAPFDEYTDPRTAALVDPRSTDDIADALARLLGDPGLRARLGSAAHVASGRFTWRRSADAHLAHYAAITGRSPSPAPRSPKEGEHPCLK
jgi:glycosyltransferase-like protein